ncbi:MAG TPA: carboxylating nicotinate-nucleotide diphosphorylase [Nitrospirota bacterium]|nr:carboxylating nicotinate-nucleotide diphosphorylase [Nitrospirota bacterium]
MMLPQHDIRAIIDWVLGEDIGPGDITTKATVEPGKPGEAAVVAKEDMVLAGADVFKQVFHTVNPGVKFVQHYTDGERVGRGEVIMLVHGPLDVLLTGERVALNLMQRMSGIATVTAAYVRETAGTKAKILDTRKTMPGLRVLDKYAVKVGGGVNHRMGLYDAFLIKDNHIAAAGGIAAAVARAKKAEPKLDIEVECEDMEDVRAALEAGADVIMLDNMGIDAMREAVREIAGRAKVEASGNMTLGRIREVAGTGVDFISVGALTHSAPAVDISMKVTP